MKVGEWFEELKAPKLTHGMEEEENEDVLWDDEEEEEAEE